MKHIQEQEHQETREFCDNLINELDIDNFIKKINGSLNLERLIDDVKLYHD